LRRDAAVPCTVIAPLIAKLNAVASRPATHGSALNISPFLSKTATPSCKEFQAYRNASNIGIFEVVKSFPFIFEILKIFTFTFLFRIFSMFSQPDLLFENQATLREEPPVQHHT
jgi:hypothetical protein